MLNITFKSNTTIVVLTHDQLSGVVNHLHRLLRNQLVDRLKANLDTRKPFRLFVLPEEANHLGSLVRNILQNKYMVDAMSYAFCAVLLMPSKSNIMITCE